MEYEKAKKKWRIHLELSNNKTSFDTVTMAELSFFIKRERRRSNAKGLKPKPLTPVEPWLLDIAFRRFHEIFGDNEGLHITSMELTPLMSK